MTHPTEERLWDWIDGVIANRPHKPSRVLINLAIMARSADPEDFTNMLPLLRLYYHKHPEYSYKDEPRAKFDHV